VILKYPEYKRPSLATDSIMFFLSYIQSVLFILKRTKTVNLVEQSENILTRLRMIKSFSFMTIKNNERAQVLISGR